MLPEDKNTYLLKKVENYKKIINDFLASSKSNVERAVLEDIKKKGTIPSVGVNIFQPTPQQPVGIGGVTFPKIEPLTLKTETTEQQKQDKDIEELKSIIDNTKKLDYVINENKRNEASEIAVKETKSTLLDKIKSIIPPPPESLKNIPTPEEAFTLGVKESIKQPKKLLNAFAQILEGVKQVEKGMVESVSFGLIDLDKGFAGEMFKPQLVDFNDKTIKTLNDVGEFAGWMYKYGIGAKLLESAIGGGIGALGNSKIINFAIKNEKYVKKGIDLVTWIATDLADVNNFKLTDEEKKEGKTIPQKIIDQIAITSALWGALMVGGAAFRGAKKLVTKAVGETNKFPFKIFRKTFDKINEVLDKRAAEKVSKQIQEIKTSIEKVDEIPAVEKNIKEIEKGLSVEDGFNVNNWINKVQERNALYGKKIKEIFMKGGKLPKEEVAYFQELEKEGKELFEKEIGKAEFETLQGLGEKFGSGFRVLEKEIKPDLKTIEEMAQQEKEFLEKSILRFSKQSSTKEVVKSVLDRYQSAINELGEMIKSGKKVSELDDVVIPAKLKPEEIQELKIVGEKFKNSGGTFKEFVSTILNRDIEKLTPKEIKEASIFANKFQYRGIKEMYNDLLASNPEVFELVNSTKQTREAVVDTLSKAKKEVSQIKNKNIFDYIEKTTKNNPDYTYRDMLIDYVQQTRGMKPEEFDKIMRDPQKWNDLLNEIDKEFENKYKKTSHKMFERWISEGAEGISEEKIVSQIDKVIRPAEESATPILDDIVKTQTIENQKNLVNNVIDNALKIETEKGKTSISFLNENLESAFKNVQENKKDIATIVKESAKNIKEYLRSLGGEFETSETLNKKFPLFINELIKIRALPTQAIDFAARTLREIVFDLNREEKELLRRAIVLTQSYIDAVSGKNNPMTGYILKGQPITEKTIEMANKELKETLYATYTLIQQKYPKVIDAIKRHAEVMRAIRDEFKIMKDVEIVLKDASGKPLSEDIYNTLKQELFSLTKIANITPEDLYFHHDVLDYTAQYLGNSVYLPKQFKKPFNPYLMPKKGTFREINTDYERVMFDYLSRTKFILEMEKKYTEIAEKFDITNFVSDIKNVDISLLNNSFRHGQYISEEVIPTEILEKFPDVKWKAFQFDKGRNFFKTKALNESVFERAIEEEATVEEFAKMVGERGGAAIRDVIAVGKKKEVIILPEEIFAKLNKLRSPKPEESKLLVVFRSYNSWFKPFVTKWYGGLAWRLTNTLGDFCNLFFFHPEAVTKLGKAISLAWEITQKNPKDYSLAAKQLKEKLMSEAYLSSSFVTEYLERSLYKSSSGKIGLFKKMSVVYDTFSSFLELTPKLASLLENLSRIEKGKQPIIRMADEYIKELAKQGFVEEAAYSFGRAITVDYAAMPQHFRGVFTDAVAPFAFWFARMVQSYARGLKEKPIYTLSYYYTPLLAIYLWNNLPQNKKIYDALPDSEKTGLFVILGQKDNGDAVIFRFYRPIDIVAQIFAVDKIIPRIEKVVEGKMTIEEAAWETVEETFRAPFDFANKKLLSPIIRFFENIVAETDKKKGFKESAEDLIKKMAVDLLPPIQRIYYTDLKTDFRERPMEWIRNVGLKPFDIANQYFVERTIGELFFKKAQETQTLINKQRDGLINEAVNSFLEGDKEKFKSLAEEFSERYPDENLELLLIRRPAFIEAIVKELARRQPDDKTRSTLQNIYYILQTYDIFKSLPKSTRQQFLELMSK